MYSRRGNERPVDNRPLSYHDNKHRKPRNIPTKTPQLEKDITSKKEREESAARSERAARAARAIIAIKESIKGVKDYISIKINKKSELLNKIVEVEQTKLDNLENEMINMINVNETDVNIQGTSVLGVTAPDNGIIKIFDNLFKNLSIELHNSLGYTEQTIEIIEQQAEAEHTPVQQHQQSADEPNIQSLNTILKALADNLYDPMYTKELKKQLLFTENSKQGKPTSYSIRLCGYGISITYCSLKEFFDKISSRVDFVMRLCWMFGCPDNFVIKIKQLQKLYKDYNTKSTEVFNVFKETVKVFLEHEKKHRTYPNIEGGKKSITSRTKDIPQEILILLPTTVSGGKRNKPKPRKEPKPRKTPKPRKAAPKPRKAK
jgi:hypothetical protein